MSLAFKYFMELSKPWEYDFKNEYPWGKEMPEQIDSISKFLEYKATGSNFDCDCCDLTNEIYARLWDCRPLPAPECCKWSPRYSLGVFEEAVNAAVDVAKRTVIFNKGSLERDTMNSFKTTYNQALIIEIKKHPNIELCNYQNTYGWIIIKRLENDHPNLLEAVNTNKALQKFACLTHSIGDFTMLFNPNIEKYKSNNGNPSFNVGRYRPTKDYWDLSLDLIRNELGDDKLYKAYIKTFSLEECVDASFNAVPLFTRKVSPDKPEPQTMMELEEFLNNVNHIIETRGKKMISMLR